MIDRNETGPLVSVTRNGVAPLSWSERVKAWWTRPEVSEGDDPFPSMRVVATSGRHRARRG